MEHEDIYDLFKQKLLEGISLEESPLEEGLFSRLKVRAKSLKSIFKNKVAKLGGSLGVYNKHDITKANIVYMDTLLAELDKIYKPKFDKLIQNYFKDSIILSESVLKDQGLDRNELSSIWEAVNDGQTLDEIYLAIKITLTEVIKNHIKFSDIDFNY